MKTKEKIFDELLAMQTYIESLDKDTLKDLQVMSETLIELTQMLAMSAGLVADATYIQRTAKKNAYLTFMASDQAQDGSKYFTSSLIKDFVDSKFASEAQLLEYADRMNRTLTHTIDAFRSVLSAIKTEMQSFQYSSQKH